MDRGGRLAFDVGMHNGDDTAYYLYKGFSVLAIEANPVMVELAEKRFDEELKSGSLRILNIGIAEDTGVKTFFVSEQNSVWSSFDRANATKGGGSCHAIEVPCIPFEEVLSRYDAPHYLKIDIEGNDHLCVRALGTDSLPDYVSLEMSHESGDADIAALSRAGYRRFKCVRQNDFAILDPDNVQQQNALRRLTSRTGAVGSFLARAARAARFRLRPPADGRWRFKPGSSGRFGPDLGGRWLSEDEILRVWKVLHDIDRKLQRGGLGEWFDIHAAA